MDILYIGANGSYSRVVLKDESVRYFSIGLGQFQVQLGSCEFFRIHKSYLVNLNCIKRVLHMGGGMLELINGTELKIARGRKKVLMSAITSGKNTKY